MRCIDLGSGGGEVTLGMASLVAPGGVVTGVDMDQVKLDLARHAAVDRGMSNVEFLTRDVNEWDAPRTYDVVFSRFLLEHLSQPLDLLRRMWAAVRPGGVLVIEDADHEGWCCYPPNDAFDFFVSSFCQVIRRRGGDHALGRKLYRYFLDAKIPEPRVSLVQPVHTGREQKALAWSTLEATAEAIAAEGIASKAELRAARTDLEEFADDPSTLMAFPRVFQLWSMR
jgi:ubiquinone/menaquinone biosynthesis C-methylase UbiE